MNIFNVNVAFLLISFVKLIPWVKQHINIVMVTFLGTFSAYCTFEHYSCYLGGSDLGIWLFFRPTLSRIHFGTLLGMSFGQ